MKALLPVPPGFAGRSWRDLLPDDEVPAADYNNCRFSCRKLLRGMGAAPYSPFESVADLAAVFDDMPPTGALLRNL